MIKFFRKIRQKLLSENKVSKYLFYAIGEIVLVVIGILIAVRINNWNEDRIAKSTARNFLISLKQDLKKDSTDLAISIGFNDEKLLQLETLRQKMERPAFTADSLMFLNANDFDVYFAPIRRFKDATFKSLISSGKIELLGAIQKPLLELDALHSELKDIADNFQPQYFEVSSLYFKEYAGLNSNKLYLSKFTSFSDIDSEKHAKDFLHLMLTKGTLLQRTQGKRKEIQSLTQKILADISRELKP
ncbi:DUF6090 family protein [Robiginitalea sp. IMCC43444]|uniref:DUF6090 family protein n=1 Tax=Robiginitalea sp. IMCC43444 TaxID=3459121 RepID=UPI004041E4E5